MRADRTRTFLAGLAGGVAMSAAMGATFRLIGFGIDGDGILLDPERQSAKLIAVWTTLEPLPRIVTHPIAMSVGFLAFGVVHALVYRWVSPAWPPGLKCRAMRFATLLFAMTFTFWEFFTPFNQLGEPLALIGIELLFWIVVAVAEGFAIAFVMERGRESCRA